jgi:hypothetical protein
MIGHDRLLNPFEREYFFGQRDELVDILNCSEKVESKAILKENLKRMTVIDSYITKEYQVSFYVMFKDRIDPLMEKAGYLK